MHSRRQIALTQHVTKQFDLFTVSCFHCSILRSWKANSHPVVVLPYNPIGKILDYKL